MTLPSLRVHEKFMLALDQFQKMLADLADPRTKMGFGKAAVTGDYVAPAGSDTSPPDEIRVRCSNIGLAQSFGTIMDKMNPLHARAVRYHFMISSYSLVSDEWEKVATTEARYFKTPVLQYIGLIQSGVDHITEQL